MIDTIEHNALLGNSDHETLEFNFRFGIKQTSVYFYYKISVFQTAVVKGRNRNSYEYKNCTTDSYSVK